MRFSIKSKWFLAQHVGTDIVKDSKEKPSGFDSSDQGCISCSPKDIGPNKENISLSSSSDDETEQEISLNMNKKTSNIGYKSKYYSIYII